MFKRIFFLIMLSSFFLLCKQEKLEVSDQLESLNYNCIQDSILVEKILKDDLLFGETYTLLDSIPPYLIIGRNTTADDQKELILNLIERDSIPNGIYSYCSSKQSTKWKKHKGLKLLKENETKNIFKENFMGSGSGGGDGYEIIKKITGNTGMVSISNIYYSDHFNYALVGVKMACGWRCGQSVVRLYALENMIWNLKMNYILSES